MPKGIVAHSSANGTKVPGSRPPYLLRRRLGHLRERIVINGIGASSEILARAVAGIRPRIVWADLSPR